MIKNKKLLSLMFSASLCVALLSLAGCDRNPDATAAASAQKTQTATFYVPLITDQLFQLVAPIAPFPDNLVAQVLEASSYPDQVIAADNWLVTFCRNGYRFLVINRN